jgi:hypothetical protein
MIGTLTPPLAAVAAADVEFDTGVLVDLRLGSILALLVRRCACGPDVHESVQGIKPERRPERHSYACQKPTEKMNRHDVRQPPPEQASVAYQVQTGERIVVPR